MTEGQETIIVYGTTWCGDCRRARQFLDAQGVPYQWVNIENDLEAVEYVKRVNQGRNSVPTIVFPDGSILVEPSNAELTAKLGLGA